MADQGTRRECNRGPRRVALVAPASDERKARKALTSRADEVVLDLEDAVLPENKASARLQAAELVEEFGDSRRVSIRINALSTEWADADLTVCSSLADLSSVVLPKAESAVQIRHVDEQLQSSTARIQALVETPIGIRDVEQVAAATPRLDSLVIGYADLGAALGRSATPGTTWAAVQDRVLIGARAAGIDAIDGPHLTIADDDGFRTAKTWVQQLGFDGTWVIHPQQIDGALMVFTPGADEISEARRVLAALAIAADSGAGAASLDGRMLDEAVAVAARRTLTKADADADA